MWKIWKTKSYNLEIFNSYGHFVDPKKPLKIKNHDLFTFYANGVDSLSLEFKLLNSQLKIHPKTINQFIYANKLYNIIELTEDTLYINLINNGLCEIDILKKSNVQNLYFGFKENENIKTLRNWSILDSNLSMIKIKRCWKIYVTGYKNIVFVRRLTSLLFRGNNICTQKSTKNLYQIFVLSQKDKIAFQEIRKQYWGKY